VLHERSGLLVPAEDAGALAAALARLIQSPQLRERMGAAGRVHAGQACRPDLTAIEYVGLYRRLLAGELQLPGRDTSVVARARS
jgi:glycosyltransferase involved in cell wall biosynthesis